MRNFAAHLHQFLRTKRVAEMLHLSTTHSPRPRIKEYHRMQRIPLEHFPRPEATLIDTLHSRASVETFNGGALTLPELGSLLQHALGRRPDSRFRTYPAGGALYTIEAYPFLYNVDDAPRALTHFRPDENTLEVLWDLNCAPEDIAKPTAGAAVQIVLTALWNRKTSVYGDFGFELTFMDAGHLGQNILLMATALGLEARPICGFRDAAIIEMLDLDPEEEQPIYLIGIGSSRR